MLSYKADTKISKELSEKIERGRENKLWDGEDGRNISPTMRTALEVRLLLMENAMTIKQAGKLGLNVRSLKIVLSHPRIYSSLVMLGLRALELEGLDNVEDKELKVEIVKLRSALELLGGKE